MRKPNFSTILLLAPVHLLLLGILAIPSLYVFWLSLNVSSYGTGSEFIGLENYARIFADPYFWKATLNTFIVVNAVVYVELILGLGLAVIFVRGVPLPRLMLAIVLMPYAISQVVGVLTWKLLMDPNIGPISRAIEAAGFGQFNWSVAPGQGLALISTISVWHNLPFTFLLLYAGMLAIPRSVYEAASMDGANGWQLFWNITLPLMLPSILLALIFRLVFAFRLFEEVWLLTKGGPARLTEVLAVYLYERGFRYGEFGIAGATGWMMVVGSLLLASFYLYKMHRQMVNSHA